MTVPSWGANPIVAGTSNADVIRGILEEIKAIFNGNIQADNLAAASVTAVKLMEKAITEAKMAANIVNNVKVAAQAVTSPKLNKFSQTQAVAAGASTVYLHNLNIAQPFPTILFTDSEPTQGESCWAEVVNNNQIDIHNTDTIPHNIRLVVF